MFLGILGTATQEASAQTCALVPARTSRVGDTILIAIGSGATSTNDAAFSATDTKGNTWTEIEHEYRSGTSQLSILRSTLTGALGPADTITLGHSGVGVTLWTAAAFIFDDLSATDVSLSTNGGTGAPLSTGNTTIASQNLQLVFSAFVYSGTGVTFTPAPSAEFSKQFSVGTSSIRNLGVQIDYVNAPGARSASATISASSAWCGAVVGINSVLQPQLARPTSTITGGTPSPDWMTSHAVVTDYDATSFDDSIPSPVDSPKEYALGPLETPADLTSVRIIVEASRANATSGSFKIILKEGTTVRATSSAYTLTNVPQFFEYTVPEASAAAVTDWTNLRVRVEDTAS